MGGGGMDMDF